MNPGVMPQIQNMVVLMLENRSFDAVLGWLHGGGAAPHVVPEGSAPAPDGIPADAQNAYHDRVLRPSHGTARCKDPWRVPRWDPYEPFTHVEKQLYADGDGHVPGGDVWAGTPRMSGFAWDYAELYDADAEVMGAYSAAELPVLYGLAEGFAVSDRWFASVPTQTDPNRAFSLAGTSLGKEDNSQIDAHTFAATPTLFNVLGDAGFPWAIYYQYKGPFSESGEASCYTAHLLPKVSAAPNGAVRPYADLLEALEGGAPMPRFCYVEPYWGGGAGSLLTDDFIGIQGNDYHPPAWVGPAEVDLLTLYETLVKGPHWPHTLLVILFDEHGGTWDHVPPTTTVAPDGHVGASGFRFERLGVRVPAILVSPFIQAGTVFRAPAGSAQEFDHTSLIATVLRWAGLDPKTAGLGARVAQAPTFEGVLSREARTDVPRITVPPSFAGQGGGRGTLHVGAGNTRTMDGPTEQSIDVRVFRAASEAADDAESLGATMRGWLGRL